MSSSLPSHPASPVTPVRQAANNSVRQPASVAPFPALPVVPMEEEAEYEPDVRDLVLFEYISAGQEAGGGGDDAEVQLIARKRGESFF